MREFKLHRSYRGRDITAFVLQTQNGIHASLYGGDLPHIGAVGIVDTDGNRTVTEFPTHREGIICKTWTAALSDAGFCPVVVEAGIHYDGLNKAGIQTVLSLADELLEETIQRILSDHSIEGN